MLCLPVKSSCYVLLYNPTEKLNIPKHFIYSFFSCVFVLIFLARSLHSYIPFSFIMAHEIIINIFRSQSGLTLAYLLLKFLLEKNSLKHNTEQNCAKSSSYLMKLLSIKLITLLSISVVKSSCLLKFASQ